MTADFVKGALEKGHFWDVGNQVLYRLCAEHPGHSDVGVIASKIWLIGRAYAASVERRPKGYGPSGDAFYVEYLGPKFRKANIDTWLRELAVLPVDDSAAILKAHNKMTKLFKKYTGHERRSLASKYLHFHFPERFFIYDFRARGSVTNLTRSSYDRRKWETDRAEADVEYAEFWCRCDLLRGQIRNLTGHDLNPRQLDNILLAWSAANDEPKNVKPPEPA